MIITEYPIKETALSGDEYSGENILEYSTRDLVVSCSLRALWMSSVLSVRDVLKNGRDRLFIIFILFYYYYNQIVVFFNKISQKLHILSLKAEYAHHSS